MEKNVLIPVSLVPRIIEMLGYLEITRFDPDTRDDYYDIMHSLSAKMRKLDLRDAYAKIITADNEDSRHDARINYLWKKGQLYSR